jgi:hypothetical protein
VSGTLDRIAQRAQGVHRAPGETAMRAVIAAFSGARIASLEGVPGACWRATPPGRRPSRSRLWPAVDHGPSGVAGPPLRPHRRTPADIAPTSTPTTPAAPAASGRTRRSRATEMTRRRRRGATARRAGHGLSPSCSRRIRSSADAVEGRSMWPPTSQTRWRSGRSWTTLTSARPSRLPQIRAVLSVPVDDEGREIETQPA